MRRTLPNCTFCIVATRVSYGRRVVREGQEENIEAENLEATDLCVPIYLNQQAVFDLLAVLEDGFYQISSITTAEGESQNRKTAVGGSIGASNVFALLGITFKGEHAREKGSQEQTEVARDRVHTPTSLFSRLRMALNERSLLTRPQSLGEIEGSTSGQFVEFRAVLRKNPLEETLEGLLKVLRLVELFSEESSHATTQGGRKKGRRGKGGGQGVQLQSEEEQAAQLMQGILDEITQAGSLEIVGEMLDVPGATAVLSTKPEFFSDRDASEIIDGEFRVLGKVIRAVPTDSDDSINLLRKTSFGLFDERIFEGFSDGFEEGREEFGLRLPEFVTVVEGPALQVFPIAIFA